MKVKLAKGQGSINFSISDNMIIDTLTGKDIPALSHGQIKTKITKGIKKFAPLKLLK